MAQQARSADLARAIIVRVWQETPTVKGLTLKLGTTADTRFSFSPGQWVDFHAPGVKHIGGYSICSSSTQLQQQGTIDLCVKNSRHPCAQWVHNQAQPAAEVYVKTGGTFTLATNSSSKPSLFIAGGIGITALAPMIAEVVQQQQVARKAHRCDPTGTPFVIYSATQPDEFALLQQLAHWHLEGSLQLQLHTTRTHGCPDLLKTLATCYQQTADNSSMPQLVEGRIGKQHLSAALQKLHNGKIAIAESYVCGPPKMTDDMIKHLLELGMLAKNVHSERWW